MTDYLDAPELYNPDVTFYSMSKDDSMLSIDVRPYESGCIIPLGVYCTLNKVLKIVAAKHDIPKGVNLYLHDKYMNKKELITGIGYSYSFIVDSNKSSWGNNRFELITEGEPAGLITLPRMSSSVKVKVVPNPATKSVTVYTEGVSGEVNIRLIGITGQVYLLSRGGDKQTLLLEDLPSGIYIAEIETSQGKELRKIIKQ